MTANLLIVGGTGFIGSHLAKSAKNKGYRTYVISLNLPLANSKIKDIEYIQADINNLEQLKKKLPIYNFDYVVNLSGYVDHSKFMNGGRQVIDTHFTGILNLLEVINLSFLKRFVQIGSSDEYGNLSAPQNEGMSAQPISPYSLAKLSSTKLMQMLSRSEGLPAVILRFFLVYGPYQNKERFIPQIIKGCYSGGFFPVSNGVQVRDFCYIDDIVEGVLMTFSNNSVNGEVVNLASGKPIKIREVIDMVSKLIGNGEPSYGQIEYRSGENMTLFADISKAKKLMNWEPKISKIDFASHLIFFIN